MSVKPRPIEVSQETDLICLLDAADVVPLLLKHRGSMYTLQRVESNEMIDNQPDRAEVLRVLDQVAGSWSDLDADQLIEEVYEARRTGSRPADQA